MLDNSILDVVMAFVRVLPLSHNTCDFWRCIFSYNTCQYLFSVKFLISITFISLLVQKQVWTFFYIFSSSVLELTIYSLDQNKTGVNMKTIFDVWIFNMRNFFKCDLYHRMEGLRNNNGEHIVLRQFYNTSHFRKNTRHSKKFLHQT